LKNTFQFEMEGGFFAGFFKSDTELLGGSEAFVAIFAQGAHDDIFESARDLRITSDLARWDRMIGEVTSDDFHRRAASERDFAREHLVKDHAHAVKVGASVQFFAFGLFWGHIIRSSTDHPEHGQCGFAFVSFGLLDLGDPKVADFDEFVLSGDMGEHDVFGFEIAVDDLAVVGEMKGREDL